MRSPRILLSVLLICVIPGILHAGGPLLVGGPAVGSRARFGVDGQPFTWNPTSMPIRYRVDPGPMAVTSSGTVVISNSTGLQRVQSMLNVWQSVSTANVSFSNAGALLPAGSYTGGDLKTVQQYNDIVGSCNSGTQSPVVFDGDGSLISSLGLPPEVIGFNQPCALDTNSGYITSALILMNGKMQDGVNSSNPTNYELTATQFDEAITHEMGHFLGLDHSQINVDLYTQAAYPCSLDELAGLPLMFPIEFCQARKDAGLPLLSPDDRSWLSSLYPSNTFSANYALISGTIYFGDGVTPVQGVNVIARQVDDPSTPEDESKRIAVSAVSGYLFTGNPGQSITGDNVNGDPTGSRNPRWIGYYQMYVPPGTYTVEVETINQDFVSGSSVGPLNPPVPMPGVSEFWNRDETAFDLPLQRDTITVHGGDKVTGTDIILNPPTPRFDQYEDNGAMLDSPIPSLDAACEVRA